MSANLENSAVATGLKYISFILMQRKANVEEYLNYSTIVLISHASKEMLKVLQARFQQCVTENFHMYKLDLEKAEEPDIKLTATIGS